MSSSGRVLFVLDRTYGHATRQIRGLALTKSLEARGWIVGFVDRASRSDWRGRESYTRSEDEIVRTASTFDVVYLLKVPSVRLVRLLRKRTYARVVFDLSDGLWRPMFQQAGWQGLHEILENVDAVFCENPYITTYARLHSAHVSYIPTSTHIEAFDQMRRTLPPRSSDRTVIGWVGSLGTVGALRAVHAPLESLFAQHPDLELRIVGCDDDSLLPPFQNVRYSLVGDYNQDVMLGEVLGMDIGIFPPPFDADDYEIRGALKAMIYMSAGVPAVCQDAGECSRLIEDNVDGMLAANEDEWTEKLELLVTSPTLRVEMGRRALATVRREHSLNHVTDELERAFLRVMAG